MTRRQLIATVKLHDDEVGKLRLREDTQAVAFLPGERLTDPTKPVLGQQFMDDPRKVRSSHVVSPAWFSNLLPEGPLRTVVSQQAGASEENDFALLTWLGRDLPGAVTVSSASNDETNVPEVPPGTDSAERTTIRHSLSGVQLKLSGEWKNHRLTVTGAGELGECIIKLPPVEHSSLAQNEAAMMDWARAAGIEVPPTMLVPVSEIDGIPSAFRHAGTTDAYVIQRFDRQPGSRRVHVEDFAQVLDIRPSNKYDSTLQTVANVVLRVAGIEELMKFIHRLVFCAACGNNDAHLKNWCFIYRDGLHASLAPAYDYVSTVLLGFEDKTHLPLLGEKEFSRFDGALFDTLARKLKVDQPAMRAQIASSSEQIWEAWNSRKPDLPLPADARALIERRKDALPLFRSTTLA
jgi:serine/threonine-protein kinase HipA